MSNYREKYFTNYANVVLGGTPKTSNPNYWGGSIPWATIEDFSDSRYIENTVKSITETGLNNSNTKLLEIGDIIISARGTVGKIVQCKKRMAFNQSCYAIKTKNSETLNQDFLYYFLIYKVLEFKQIAIGGVFDTITMKTFEKMPVSFPDIKVQKKIAANLTAYDDLMEINKRRIKILEKMAEEIYREWFVRMRFPGYEKVKFVKGIPLSFSTDKANLSLDYVKGRSYSSEEISDFEGEVPFINLKSFLRGGGYRHDGIKYYSGKYSEEQLVYPKDIVLAVTDMTQNREIVGRVARIPQFFFEKATISLDVIKIIPKNISKTFIYSFLRYSGFGLLLKEFANGSNVLHLSPSVIKKQIMLLPPKQLQEKFDEIANPLYEKIDYLSYSNNLLNKSKALLLPRLLSGKLSVENLDIKYPPSMEEVNA